jgi:haloalkane dehalogenase
VRDAGARSNDNQEQGGEHNTEFFAHIGRGEKGMTRRDFLYGSSAAGGTAYLLGTAANAGASDVQRRAKTAQPSVQPIDAKAFHATRKFADLPVSRVAYVERGHGLAALFVHGYALNGFQWRGALERLQVYRRCIAPDVMGMGYTQTPEGQVISPETQAEMLGMLLDSLHIDTVDLVANDSGGLVAQLFLAKYPHRVRTLLLTNCDVDENNPPPKFVPFIGLAKQGLLVDQFIVPHLNDKQFARSAKGMGGLAYTHPESFTDEVIETYFRPLVETPLRKSQLNQYTASFATNDLVGIREDLQRWKGPARMVWALKDVFFGVEWAEWLDRTLPGSRGVRRLEGANLFFPEEMPEVIAEEAMALWDSSPLHPR